MIEDGRGGIVVIAGGPGSGKTTALRHLAAILPPWARGRVRLLEELDLTGDRLRRARPPRDPRRRIAMARSPGHEKVDPGYSATSSSRPSALLPRPSVYRLAPWDQDDAIEYLLATHRERLRLGDGPIGPCGRLSISSTASRSSARSCSTGWRATSRSATSARRLQGELAARLDGRPGRRRIVSRISA